MNDVEQYFGIALWYAWGRIDSGQYKDSGLELDAFEFAYIVKGERLAFVTGKSVSSESIQGQWNKYVESKS